MTKVNNKDLLTGNAGKRSANSGNGESIDIHFGPFGISGKNVSFGKFVGVTILMLAGGSCLFVVKTCCRIKEQNNASKNRREEEELRRMHKMELKQNGEMPNAITPEVCAPKTMVMAQPYSTHQIFNRLGCQNAEWLVDGYIVAGQVSFILGAAGMSKSVIMTQIARAVAKGERPEFLPKGCSKSARKDVIYYRLEDYPAELQGKYGSGKAISEAGDIKWYLPEHLQDLTLDSLLTHVQNVASDLTADTAVFIDPITKLNGFKPEKAIKGLERAAQISQKRGCALTFILVAHLHETKPWNPLTSCDICGGNKLIQQAGSVFAIRKEKTAGDEFRYFKCLKEPKGCPNPYPDGVLVCKKIVEDIDDYNKDIYFEFASIKPEIEARPLKPKPKAVATSECPDEETPNRARPAPNQKVTPEVERIIRNGKANGDKPKVIAKEIWKREKTNISIRTVKRWMKKLAADQ